MKPIFSGTTAACLQHLETLIQGDQNAKQIIARFVGVEVASVNRWLREAHDPTGQPLIRLRFYLEFIGFEVHELQTLPDNIRRVGRLWAFGVIETDKLLVELGHEAGRGALDTFLAVLRGREGVSKARAEKYDAISSTYSHALPAKQRGVEKIQLVQNAQPERVVVAPPREVLLEPETGTTLTPPQIIEMLACSIKGMSPLVALVASDAFSPDHRAHLRERVGNREFFHFVNRLHCLLGEDTRKAHQLQHKH